MSSGGADFGAPAGHKRKIGMIEVDGLTKYYGGFLAVDGVSFAVPEGQVVGLLEIGRASWRERV